MTEDALLATIEQKRTELIKIVQKHGLLSSITIKYSQELDSLLNTYNKLRLPHIKSLSEN